jgi:hypothetical protein
MKVTRLKKGYRITLSDSEFEALDLLVEHGAADFEGEDLSQHPIRPHVKRVIRSGTFSRQSPLTITEDRR